jgi:hypothetical protein
VPAWVLTTTLLPLLVGTAATLAAALVDRRR